MRFKGSEEAMKLLAGGVKGVPPALGEVHGERISELVPPFAFSTFSYPLPQQRPSRVACLDCDEPKSRRRIGLTTFPSLPTRQLREPIRLAPASFPMALRRRTLKNQERNQPFTFWFEPNSSFGSSCITGIRTAVHFTLCMRNLPSLHTARLLAVSTPSSSPR